MAFTASLLIKLREWLREEFANPVDYNEILTKWQNSDKIPTSSTNNAIVRFDGTDGTLKNSTVTVDNSGNIATSGTVDGIDVSTLGTRVTALEAIDPIKRIKITKGYADFAAAALTNDIEILSLPATAKIVDIYAYVPIVFLGGLISAYTISVGIVGTDNKYLLANSVFTGCDQSIVEDTLKGTALTTSGLSNVESFTASTSIRAFATSVGDNLDLATQGSIEIYIEYIE